MTSKKVGVIGGLGPDATIHFMEYVLNNTDSLCDQDNVDMIVCQYSSTPDRTAFILGKSKQNPLPKMIEEAKLLEREHCNFIVMPCNTACNFYDEIEKNISIPFLNIVDETLKACESKGYKKIGLMATEGTVKSKVYQKYLKPSQKIFVPQKEFQKEITHIIYDLVKSNKNVPLKEFQKILSYYRNNKCDVIIVGCTELSVAYNDLKLKDKDVIDAMNVLARKTVELSGKKLK